VRVRALILVAVLAALALPAAASAHAYLVQTVPAATGIVPSAPSQVELTYDEAVEPRFAIVSVTDASGRQLVDGKPTRSPTNPNTLVVPLKHAPEGWYLVYWRVISVDGHPVRGAYTYQVGPNPGPAPQFPVPSISETAATPGLVAARTAVFLSVMSAIGLFVLRLGIARPLVRRLDDEVSPAPALRALHVAFGVAAGVALVATPIYLLLSTAEFALRPATAIGDLLPLIRASAFGRGFVDLELCFALFAFAAGVAFWVDRPERPRRSLAELFATAGAFAGAAAVLVIPGAAGHAAQTSPRGLSLALDWIHLVAGSVWVGGLIGLLVVGVALPAAVRRAGLAVVVPRFSNVALVSVLLLLGSGIWATVNHMPTVGAMWQTSYGKTILIKITLVVGALALASVNLLWTRSRLASDGSATLRLRQLVSGEVILVGAAVLGGALLSSFPPPAKALAKEGSALARVGPGPVVSVVHNGDYTLKLRVAPNKAAVPNQFALQILRGGKPVTGADVKLGFAMLDMEMGEQQYRLTETGPGIYTQQAPALVMVGHWGLDFEVTPRGGQPFSAFIVDRAAG
jgi:copper transport protein